MIGNSVYCSASVCFIFSVQNQKSVGGNSYFSSIILLIMWIYAWNFVCCNFMVMFILNLMIDFFLPLYHCSVCGGIGMYFLTHTIHTHTHNCMCTQHYFSQTKIHGRHREEVWLLLFYPPVGPRHLRKPAPAWRLWPEYLAAGDSSTKCGESRLVLTGRRESGGAGGTGLASSHPSPHASVAGGRAASRRITDV